MIIYKNLKKYALVTASALSIATVGCNGSDSDTQINTMLFFKADSEKLLFDLTYNCEDNLFKISQLKLKDIKKTVKIEGIEIECDKNERPLRLVTYVTYIDIKKDENGKLILLEDSRSKNPCLIEWKIKYEDLSTIQVSPQDKETCGDLYKILENSIDTDTKNTTVTGDGGGVYTIIID